jgi:dihydrofolate reductase
MKKIIASLHVSLDGFAAGPNGEMNWIKVDSEMFDFVKTFTDEADTALYGRVTWQMMDSYWPHAGEEPGASQHDKDHSEWYNRVNKVVISNSLQGTVANKTSFFGGDVISAIEQLKMQTGGDILIFGSPSIVRLLMANNLIDEYWLFMNPVILGKGIPIYANMENAVSLKLVSSRTFSLGVVALNYTLLRDS